MSGDAYRDAGVDIEAGEALVDRIKPLAKATTRPGVIGGLGGFGGLFSLAGYKDPVLAGVLNILPGFGNFYLAYGTQQSGQWGIGLFNLLLWPISPIWGIPEAAIDAGNTLIATSRSRLVSWARQTTPIPPSPSLSTMR